MSKKVSVLAFSSRKNGNCAAISQYISQFYNRTNVSVSIFDGSVFSPCNSCDYECLRPGVRCPVLTQEQETIMDVICGSELVYFVVPNFCGQPCANYYAFNERTVGYFNMDREKMKQYMAIPKRFVIVSNTEGFEKAMQQQTADAPACLYMKSGKYGKQSIAGDLMESDEARKDLDGFLLADKL